MRTAVWNLSGMRPFSKIIALWQSGWQQLLQDMIFGLPLIILIVIIAIFVYHRRQRKPAKRTDMSKYDTPMDRYEILDKTYNRQQPADYKTVTFLDDEDGNNRRLPGVEGNQYSTGLPEEWNEYSSQLPPNEDNDYSRGLPEDEPSEYTYSRGLPDD